MIKINSTSCLVLGTLLFVGNAKGATCSCAAVPLLNSLEATSAEDQQWVAGISYQYQDISDLYSGSDEIKDDTDRERFSESAIVQIDYGISENWAVTGLFSYVEHQRKVGVSNGSRVTSRGFGDSVILFKYTSVRFDLFSSLEYGVGLGAKIPTGDNDEKNNGIILAEDMQPGSGAYSWIVWGYMAYALDPATRSRLFLSSNYSFNEENDRKYRLGDELNISFGASHYFENSWAATLQLSYRTTEADERSGFSIPNTGGEWLDFNPSVQYVFDQSAIKVAGKVPLYRDLDGALQFTSSSAITVGYSYIF